jgi:hypothetical protein
MVLPPQPCDELFFDFPVSGRPFAIFPIIQAHISCHLSFSGDFNIDLYEGTLADIVTTVPRLVGNMAARPSGP